MVAIPKRSEVEPERCQSRMGIINVLAAVTQFLGPNPHRIGLLISAPDTLALYLRTVNSVDEAFALLAGASPLMLNVWDHGSLVTGPWFQNGTAGAIAGFIEVVYL